MKKNYQVGDAPFSARFNTRAAHAPEALCGIQALEISEKYCMLVQWLQTMKLRKKSILREN